MSPGLAAVTGPRGTVWVTNQTLNTVAAYDARNGSLLGTFKVRLAR